MRFLEGPFGTRSLSFSALFSSNGNPLRRTERIRNSNTYCAYTSFDYQWIFSFQKVLSKKKPSRISLREGHIFPLIFLQNKCPARVFVRFHTTTATTIHHKHIFRIIWSGIKPLMVQVYLHYSSYATNSKAFFS